MEHSITCPNTYWWRGAVPWPTESYKLLNAKEENDSGLDEAQVFEFGFNYLYICFLGVFLNVLIDHANVSPLRRNEDVNNIIEKYWKGQKLYRRISFVFCWSRGIFVDWRMIRNYWNGNEWLRRVSKRIGLREPSWWRNWDLKIESWLKMNLRFLFFVRKRIKINKDLNAIRFRMGKFETPTCCPLIFRQETKY